MRHGVILYVLLLSQLLFFWTPGVSADNTGDNSDKEVYQGTAIPALDDDFSEARLLYPVALPNWNMGLTFQLDKEIKGVYRAEIGPTRKDYPCERLDAYQNPDRLFCFGRLPAVDKTVSFTIINTQTNQPVMDGEFYIPLDILYSMGSTNLEN
jgi:hypothetical protein